MELSEERKQILSERLINAKKRRDDANELKTKLKGEISKIENEKKELRLQIAKIEDLNNIDELSNINSKYSNEINSLIERKQHVNEDFNKCEDLIKQVMKRLLAERKTKQKIEEVKKEATKDLEKLTKEIEKTTSEPLLKEKNEIIANEMKNKVSKWRKQYKALTNQLTEKKAQLEAMLGEQKDAKYKISQQMQEIAELEGRSRRRDATIDECKRDLADQSEDNQNLLLYLQKIHDDRTKKEAELLSLKEKNKNQIREIKKILAKKAKLEEEQKVISLKSQSVHIKLDDVMNKTITEAQEEQNKKLKEAQERNKIADETLTNSKKELEDLNDKLSQLKQQVEKEKEGLQSTRKMHEKKLKQIKEVQKQMMKTFNSDDEN